MFIKKFIQKIIKKDIKPLGRWNIEKCDKKINKKIDFSNEDHCGPCGNIFLQNKYKFELSNNNQNKMPNDN